MEQNQTMFHHDNALVSPKKNTTIALQIHPLLDPCDFFIFIELKKSLGGKRFALHEEVIAETINK